MSVSHPRGRDPSFGADRSPDRTRALAALAQRKSCEAGIALDLENFLPYRIVRLSAALSNHARDVYRARHQITVPEWRALASIGQFGRVTAKEISLHSSMHKTKVSRAVTRLEKRRWIVKEKNEEDRREDFLTLTRLGRRTYEDIVPHLVAFETRLRERLGTTATNELLSALQELENTVLPTASR